MLSSAKPGDEITAPPLTASKPCLNRGKINGSQEDWSETKTNELVLHWSKNLKPVEIWNEMKKTDAKLTLSALKSKLKRLKADKKILPRPKAQPAKPKPEAADSIWTDELLVASLVQKWNAGISATLIAEQLTTEQRKITRGMVISKVQRLEHLGLLNSDRPVVEAKAWVVVNKKRRGPSKTAKPQKAAKPRPKKARPAKKAVLPTRLQVALSLAPAVAAEPPVTGPGYTMAELPDDGCLWSLENSLFCGSKKIPRFSYCAHHSIESVDKSGRYKAA